MKLRFFILAILGTGALIGNSAPAITARVYNYTDLSPSVLRQAEAEAARVLGNAGVAVQWFNYDSRGNCLCSSVERSAAPPQTGDLTIRVIPSSMDLHRHETGKALGYSILTEVRPAVNAYILYDNIRKQMERVNDVTESRVLGYSIAHEITHLLRGDQSHTAAGVMKRSWVDRDFALIEQGMMSFTPKDALALQTGMREHLAASQPLYQRPVVTNEMDGR